MSNMADLWDEFWHAMRIRQHGSVKLVWTKSHPSPEEVLLHELTGGQIYLSTAADHFAGVASARSALADGVIKAVNAADRLALQIQQRLVAINKAVLEKHPYTARRIGNIEPIQKEKQRKRREQVIAEARAMGHNIQEGQDGKLHCARCGRTRRLIDLGFFSKHACEPDGLARANVTGGAGTSKALATPGCKTDRKGGQPRAKRRRAASQVVKSPKLRGPKVSDTVVVDLGEPAGVDKSSLGPQLNSQLNLTDNNALYDNRTELSPRHLTIGGFSFPPAPAPHTPTPSELGEDENGDGLGEGERWESRASEGGGVWGNVPDF